LSRLSRAEPTAVAGQCQRGGDVSLARVGKQRLHHFPQRERRDMNNLEDQQAKTGARQRAP
jgi:hypothetical protein